MTNKEDLYHVSKFDVFDCDDVDIFDVNRLYDHITVFNLDKPGLGTMFFNVSQNCNW